MRGEGEEKKKQARKQLRIEKNSVVIKREL